MDRTVKECSSVNNEGKIIENLLDDDFKANSFGK